MLSGAAKNQTPETPNVLGIYLLGCVCDDMLKTGIDTIQKEIADKADRLYRFFDEHPPWRSSTINVIEAPEGCLPVIQKLEEAGFIVDSGYGEYKEHHVRIANFPSQNRVDLERLVDIFGNM